MLVMKRRRWKYERPEERMRRGICDGT